MYIEFVRNLLLQSEAREAGRIRGREGRQRDLEEDMRGEKSEKGGGERQTEKDEGGKRR